MGAGDKYPCVPPTLTLINEKKGQTETVDLFHSDEIASDLLEYRPDPRDKDRFPEDFKIIVKQIPIRTQYQQDGCKVDYLRLKDPSDGPGCAHIIRQKCIGVYGCKFIYRRDHKLYQGVALVEIEPMEMDVDKWIESINKVSATEAAKARSMPRTRARQVSGCPRHTRRRAGYQVIEH